MLNETKKYFNGLSKDWDEKYYNSANFKSRLNEFKLLLNKYAKNCDSSLDYGCGTGNLTELLTKYCSNVTASDLSEEMLKITTKRFENNNTVKVISLDKLDNLKFNLIICSSVIEYSADDQIFLSNLFSYLNDKGIIIITFPNKYGPLQLLNRYILSIFNNENYTTFQNHTYTTIKIKSLLKKFNLDILELYKQKGYLFNSRTFGELFFCVAKKKV